MALRVTHLQVHSRNEPKKRHSLASPRKLGQLIRNRGSIDQLQFAAPTRHPVFDIGPEVYDIRTKDGWKFRRDTGWGVVDSNTAGQIREALENFWKEQSLSIDEGSTSIDDLVAAMDSMTAVEVLVDVEKIVGMELPTAEVIRRGGYESQEQFVEDLTTRVLTYVEERGT